MIKNISYKEDIYDLSNYKFNDSLEEIKRVEKYKAKQEIINKIRYDFKHGAQIKELEQRYNCEFKTIKRYLSFDSIRYTTIKQTELDSYSSIIYKGIIENKNFYQIFNIIKEMGYKSTYQNFFKQLKIRLMTNTLGNTYQLSRHNFSKLLYKNDIKRLKLDKDNEECLIKYLSKDNIHKLLLNVVREFKEIFIKKNELLLDEWIEKYKQYKELLSLQSFISGIINDKKAVIGQINNKITNGTTEGLVGKLKVIKRRTYGRCGFDLLKSLLLNY